MRSKDAGLFTLFFLQFFVLIQTEIKCSGIKEVKLTQGICLEQNETSSCVSQLPIQPLPPAPCPLPQSLLNTLKPSWIALDLSRGLGSLAWSTCF